MIRNEAHQAYKRLIAEADAKGGDAPRDLVRALSLCDRFYLLVFFLGRPELHRY